MQSVRDQPFVWPRGEQVKPGSVHGLVIADDFKQCVRANGSEESHCGRTRRRRRQRVGQFHQYPFGRHQSPSETIEIGGDNSVGVIVRIQPGN